VSLPETLHSAASALHTKIETAAPVASYTTNGAMFTWGAFSYNEVVMLVGAILGLATYFTGLYFQKRRETRERYFQKRRDDREQELHLLLIDRKEQIADSLDTKRDL
jgi:hypothetical protein